MKVNFKTVQGSNFSLDLDASTKVTLLCECGAWTFYYLITDCGCNICT